MMFTDVLKGFAVDDAAVQERPVLALARLVPLEQQLNERMLVNIPRPWLTAHGMALDAGRRARSDEEARTAAVEALRRAGVYGDMRPSIAVAVAQIRAARGARQDDDRSAVAVATPY